MHLQQTKNDIKQLLLNESYNAVSEIISGSRCGFQCELLTDAARYEMKIFIDPQLEYVYIKVYPGIKIPAGCLQRACAYCADISDAIKIGALCINRRFGDVYFKTETSVKAAPLNDAAFKQMEALAVSTLLMCEEELLTLMQEAPRDAPLHRRIQLKTEAPSPE